MIATVTALNDSEMPTPCHSTLRSAPNDSPLPVKIAVHGAADQRPDNGCRSVKMNMASSGTNRNDRVANRITNLMMLCLRTRAARSCGGLTPVPTVSTVRMVREVIANVRPSFPRRGSAA